MTEKQLDKGKITFQTEGRLLQELGERLVARPDVALVELIKNSYDADASSCAVTFSERDNSLSISDDGLGMTYHQFASRWMRIATSHKAIERSSVRFKRHLTGQKGIGRFAVRFLGRALRLESVARDDERGCKTRLIADFDWQKLDNEDNLDHAEVPWRLLQEPESTPTGTTLKISSLRVDFDFAKSSEFRTAVLKITSPLRALDGGRFRQNLTPSRNDPGFEVTLPGEVGDRKDEFDLARTVLHHAWARLRIDLKGEFLTYSVQFHSEAKPTSIRMKHKSKIQDGVVADIRYFPRREGVFRETEVNGQKAWSWVRENHGVAVIDNGFRIKPYGMEDDDWLLLDVDAAHNERDWRSEISKQHFPIPKEMRLRSESPMLILPSNYQLVGAVFVESAAVGSRDEDALITSMDREGFLFNESFEQLVDIVRGGIEFLAREDRERLLQASEQVAKEAVKKTRADFRAAVKYIEQSSTLTRTDKARLVEEYTGLAQKLTEVEDYDREARRKLETMSALGVVAGFMTHEASRIVSSLKDVIAELNHIARRHPSVKHNIANIEEAYHALEGQLQYSRTFVDATQRDQRAKFKAAGQIEMIIERFGNFAKQRKIELEMDVEDSTAAPEMPVAVYSGIVLNLYTNALKAILATPTGKDASKVLFRAYNDKKWHNLEVLDTGIGIPPDLRKRVFDPLFTTTSRLNNPLGSGMGLGLTLVKQLVEQLSGRVAIVDSPVQGFNTCFRVQLPW